MIHGALSEEMGETSVRLLRAFASADVEELIAATANVLSGLLDQVERLGGQVALLTNQST